MVSPLTIVLGFTRTNLFTLHEPVVTENWTNYRKDSLLLPVGLKPLTFGLRVWCCATNLSYYKVLMNKGSLLWYMWRYINSCKPLCYRSLIIGHFCENNAFFILLSWLPTYFHENFPDAKVILVQCLMLVVLLMHV